ncbi:MAG: hypothetical protein ABIP90_07575, partial [Vicinamibacterales bacterium]
QPWPLAAGMINNRRVAFLQSSVADGPPSSTPGTVLEAGSAGLLVACATGAVRITEVLPEGRRAMTAAAFLHGASVTVGSAITAVAIPGDAS